ncbi:MAG: hypothetical protein SF187_27475 [Deltaproteobacteria bacterium]|nr:hypothetical protein [Deltaproteobacteria bacterium]
MDSAAAINAARTHAAFVDALPVDLIQGTGGDRIAFLHRLLSGNVTGALVGGGCHTLLLNPKGHIVSDIQLLVGDSFVRMMVPVGLGQSTADALNRYAIMDDFAAVPVAGQRVMGVVGPQAAAVLQRAGLSVPAGLIDGAVWSHHPVAFADREGWVARVPQWGGMGLRVVLPKAAAALLSDALTKAGAALLDVAAAEALRVASGELKFGVEITPERFPMELGLDDAIDYAKGCYLGQEPIVRIRDRGHVNWRVARLRFGLGGPAVVAGNKIESAVRPAAGHLTSVATLPAVGGEPAVGVALGLVHATVPPGPVRLLTDAGVVEAEVLAPH